MKALPFGNINGLCVGKAFLSESPIRVSHRNFSQLFHFQIVSVSRVLFLFTLPGLSSPSSLSPPLLVFLGALLLNYWFPQFYRSYSGIFCEASCQQMVPVFLKTTFYSVYFAQLLGSINLHCPARELPDNFWWDKIGPFYSRTTK